MNSGPTPGVYANREGRYEVLPDGRVFLIGGAALPDGADHIELEGLPADAAMTPAATGIAASGGTTPQGQAAPGEQIHREWEK